MTSNHHAPYDLGYTRATMDSTKGREAARWKKIHKTILSSDCRLQLAYMKPESRNNRGNQHATVNTFRALYTPPVTPREFVTPKVGRVTFME